MNFVKKICATISLISVCLIVVSCNSGNNNTDIFDQSATQSNKPTEATEKTFTETTGHTHNYILDIIIPATCREDGKGINKCGCGDKYNIAIAKTEHDYSKVTVEPNCTTEGYDRYTCSNCGYYYDDNIVAKHDHNYSENMVSATCTEDGYYRYTCNNCEDFYNVPISRTGHNYSSNLVSPTCTKDGYYRYTCSNCEDTYDVPISHTGHNYKKTTVSPTCTEDGYYKYDCSKCDDSYTESNGRAATGHEVEITGICSNCEGDFSVNMKDRLSSPSNFRFSQKYDAYLSYRWEATNISGKTIKYCTIRFAGYDAVGEVYWRKNVRITGPINNRDSVTSSAGPLDFIIGSYQTPAGTRTAKLEIEYVKIEYMDGTVECGYYGYSTTEKY